MRGNQRANTFERGERKGEKRKRREEKRGERERGERRGRERDGRKPLRTKNVDVHQFSEDRRRALASPGPKLMFGDVSLPLGGYMDWTFRVTGNMNYSCGIISETGIRDTRGLHDSAVHALGVRNCAYGGRMPEADLRSKRVRVCVEDNKVHIFAAGERVFESDIPPDWFPVRLGISCFRGTNITLED